MLKEYILRASKFFPKIDGHLKGRCIICGFSTDKGHRIDFSDNFTAWNLLQQGDCVCEYCYSLISNQDYRRKSWIAHIGGVTFLKRTEILPTMLNPPVPFAMYVTKTGKKQGFLHLINRVNYSKHRYFIAFDDELIFVDRRKLEYFISLAKTARMLKFTKSDLLSPSVKCWKHRKICEEIMKVRDNPLWRLVVYAVE